MVFLMELAPRTKASHPISLRQATDGSLLYLCVNRKRVIEDLGVLRKGLNIEKASYEGSLAAMLANPSWTSRPCPEHLRQPILDYVRSQVLGLCPEREDIAAVVCELFEQRFPIPRNGSFDLNEAIENANQKLSELEPFPSTSTLTEESHSESNTETHSKRWVLPRKGAVIVLPLAILSSFAVAIPFILGSARKDAQTTMELSQGPAWNAPVDYEDDVQQLTRTDDRLAPPVICQMRVGAAGSQDGFKLRSDALPNDAVELSTFVENVAAPTDKPVKLTLRLPSNATYAQGQSFVRVRQQGHDYDQPIPDKNLVISSGKVQFEFVPMSHDPGASFYLMTTCRIAGPQLFPYGSSDLAFRSLVSIGSSKETSNAVHVSVLRPRETEERFSVSLRDWNKWAPKNTWIQKSELVGKPKDFEKFEVVLINEGSKPLSDGVLELSSSSPVQFSPSLTMYDKTDRSGDPMEGTVSEGVLRIPIRKLASGTMESQIFIGSFTLGDFDNLVSVQARLLDSESVLGSDSLDIRALPPSADRTHPSP